MKPEALGKVIEKRSPLDIQEPWDNSGFQIKFEDSEINRVLVALEVTAEVIDEAVELKADAIVTHHPLIFDSLKKVCSNNVTGNYIIKLIKNDINVYSSHTPFDKCAGGNNDFLAGLLRLCDIKIMDSDKSGFCRTGLVDGQCSVAEYIERISDLLKIDKRMMSFAGDTEKSVRKVGLCTGAGAEFLEPALLEGCDLFITGDVKYHTARLAREIGLNLLDIGHYGSERIFVRNMADYLKKNTDSEIMESAADINPFAFI